LSVQLHHEAVKYHAAAHHFEGICKDVRSLSVLQAEGIGHLTALTLLELGSNRLRDLGPIAGLIGLRELWLGRNRLSSLDGMSG
jgi:Leucine Rich repeats (2 copies)